MHFLHIAFWIHFRVFENIIDMPGNNWLINIEQFNDLQLICPMSLFFKVAFELARTGEITKGIDILKDAAKAAPKDLLPPLCLSQVYDKFLKKKELAQKTQQKNVTKNSRSSLSYRKELFVIANDSFFWWFVAVIFIMPAETILLTKINTV